MVQDGFAKKTCRIPLATSFTLRLEEASQEDTGRVLAKIYTELVIVESVKIVVWSNAA